MVPRYGSRLPDGRSPCRTSPLYSAVDRTGCKRSVGDCAANPQRSKRSTVLSVRSHAACQGPLQLQGRVHPWSEKYRRHTIDRGRSAGESPAGRDGCDRSGIRYSGHRQSSGQRRSEEHTSELQSLMRICYAVFCLKKKNTITHRTSTSTLLTL